MRSRLTLCVVIVVSVLSSAREALARPSFPDLALDPTRIAVMAHDGDATSWRAALAERGLDVERSEPSAARGFWIVPANGDVESLVSDLSADPRLAFASPVFRNDDRATVIVARDLFVGFVVGEAPALAGVAEIESRFAGFDEITRVRIATRNGLEVLARARELERDPRVRFADVDLIYTGRGSHIPNDPLFPQCWGLNNTGQTSGSVADVDMDAVEAWDLTLGDPSVRIAILDVGVDRTHPDLSVAVGADTTSDGPGDGGPRNACDNHGTWVAGCAAARIDNALGAVGTAPAATIVPIRMLIASLACNVSWTTSTTWVLNALNQVSTLGCRVTNCSNGLQEQAAVTTAYTSLHNAGVVHFGSAGNGSLTTIHYPARLEIVNGVGAVNSAGVRPSWSNTGTGLDLAAPGVTIWTTDRVGTGGTEPGDYVAQSGTSMSAPYCAGIAALLLARNPSLNAFQVDAVMRGTCIDYGPVGYDTSYGHGLARARAALELGGTGCPAPASYCTTTPNSVGAGALITYSGTTSLIANDLRLFVAGAPPSTPGRFLVGRTEASVLFGNGVRCIASPYQLSATVVTSSAGIVSLALDFANLPGGASALSGETWLFQLAYRNPAAGGAGFNTSDALRVIVCP